MGWFGNSRQAIAALVEAHYAALYRYAYRLSGSSQEAEDLTQETFCLAQNKLQQLREQERAKSWLFTILRNAYLHRLRSAKLERQVSLEGIAEIAHLDAGREEEGRHRDVGAHLHGAGDLQVADLLPDLPEPGGGLVD